MIAPGALEFRIGSDLLMTNLKRGRFWFSYGILFLTLISISWAAGPTLDGIELGEYRLIPVANHTPESYKKAGDYWSALQKVELEIGKQNQFRDLPVLGMKSPFTGFITLGDQPGKFGVIVDIMGEEKRLYIDTDGDGSFKNETWSPLLDEWQGLQIYWVEGPEPVRLQVGYQSLPGKTYPMEISVSGILNKPGAFVKEQPYLKVAVRSWFLAKLVEDGGEKLAAVVDHNHNGKFSDPEDQLFIDVNDDGYFNEKEFIKRSRGVTLKDGKKKVTVDWDMYPEKLVIGGKR